jgi:hypothetical protein
MTFVEFRFFNFVFLPCFLFFSLRQVRTAAAGKASGLAHLISIEDSVSHLLPCIQKLATDDSQAVRYSTVYLVCFVWFCFRFVSFLVGLVFLIFLSFVPSHVQASGCF